MRQIVQAACVAVARPYISRELPGWGRVFDIIGSYKRDWLWSEAKPQIIREKTDGRLIELDMSKWADRSTYFLGRWYDFAAQLIIDRFVSEGETVIDGGANRGLFAFYAARRVGPRGKVICFEPNPSCASSIKRESEANGIAHVVVNASGLGDQETTLTLHVTSVKFSHAAIKTSRVAAAAAASITGLDRTEA
jgi:Methyltransferase FkbM domain